MFKDIYKQANDKIDTESAKSRVLAKLNKPAPVRKRVNAAKIAALAACFVFTIAVAGVYEQAQKDTKPISELPTPVKVAEESPKDALQNAEVEAETTAPSVAEPQAKAQPKAKSKATPTPAETVTPAQEVAQKRPAHRETTKTVVVPTVETVVESAEIAKAEEVLVIAEDSFADSTPQKASAGGGGSARNQSSGLVINQGLDEAPIARAAFAMPAGNEKEVSVTEYCEYLGKNIPEDVPMLSAMTNETAPQQMLEIDEAGGFADDSYEFLFTAEEKILKIETTKNTEELKAKIENPEYEKSKIGDSDAVILAEEDIMKAYFSPHEIGYTITSVNCNEFELEELLHSLN